MSQTNEKEIERIDKVLDQIDELLKTIPEDFQETFAFELCERFDIELKEE